MAAVLDQAAVQVLEVVRAQAQLVQDRAVAQVQVAVPVAEAATMVQSVTVTSVLTFVSIPTLPQQQLT